MSSSRFPIPQGTLDMLILQILSLEVSGPVRVTPGNEGNKQEFL